MTIHPGHTTHPSGKKLLPLALLIGTLLITACSPGVVPVTGASTVGASAPATSTGLPAINATTVPMATTAPQANQQNPNPKCDALFLANFDMGNALARMVTLTANTNYGAYTDPSSPAYIDFTKLRSELDTLATLPDPPAAEAAIAGKPSEAVVYYHQLIDMAEADIKNNGKPFVDTSPSGVKLIGFDTAWETKAAVFSMAMSNVCKDYTAPKNLLAGTPLATVDTQAQKANDALMATAAAAGANMLATLDAASTAYPQPTETPAP